MCFLFCRFWLIDIFIFPIPRVSVSECTLISTEVSIKSQNISGHSRHNNCNSISTLRLNYKLSVKMTSQDLKKKHEESTNDLRLLIQDLRKEISECKKLLISFLKNNCFLFLRISPEVIWRISYNFLSWMFIVIVVIN